MACFFLYMPPLAGCLAIFGLGVILVFSGLAFVLHFRTWRFFEIFGLGVFLVFSDLAFFMIFRTWCIFDIFGLGICFGFFGLPFFWYCRISSGSIMGVLLILEFPGVLFACFCIIYDRYLCYLGVCTYRHGCS